MESWLPSILLGIALSASAGFRVFIPLLISNLATKMGVISVSPDFAWMASTQTSILLAIAFVVEVSSFYITYVDNLLDSLAVPISVGAGTLLTTQFLQIEDPILKWGLGLIAGGGVAGTVQTGTSLLRLASTKFTAGFGNSFFTSLENILSFSISLISIWLPILTGLVCLFFVFWVFKKLVKSQK